MRESQYKYFCNCLLKNFQEHVTAVNSEGQCLYCEYFAIQREVTKKDVRLFKKHEKELEKRKMEKISILAREKNHNETIN